MITLKELLAGFNEIWLAIYTLGATDYVSAWHSHNKENAAAVDELLNYRVQQYDFEDDDDGDVWLIIHLAD